jgi:acetyltransferase-like isoleucine patch superfamily enzyme
MIPIHYLFLAIDYLKGYLALSFLRLFYGPWGTKIKFKGIPRFQIRKGAKLFLGNGVQINSTNTFYHLNMFRPVKFLLDSKQAKIEIGDQTRIHGTLLHAKDSIKIGKGCLIAANCQIFDNNGHSISMRSPEDRLHKMDVAKPIIIEDYVWLGTGVIVLPGTQIGTGTIVSANSVCKGILKPNAIYAGNPAVCISDRNNK